MYTQNAGVRPFGVSLLFGGVDDYRVSLIAIDPSGSYRGYKATSIGRNSEKARKVLTEQYRDDTTLEEAIALALDALKEAADEDLTPQNVNISIIPKETRMFTNLSEKEIQKYL